VNLNQFIVNQLQEFLFSIMILVSVEFLWCGAL
jgi:hypothetical protein